MRSDSSNESRSTLCTLGTCRRHRRPLACLRITSKSLSGSSSAISPATVACASVKSTTDRCVLSRYVDHLYPRKDLVLTNHQFEDVNFATRAMSELHGNTLKGLVKGGGIRLSYSKNPLGVRTPTSANSNGPALQQQQLQNMQSVLGPETDSSHQQHRTILRRDDHNQSGNTYNNFLASPPPRFLPSQQGGAAFFGPSSPPANSFMRPTNGGLNAFSYGLAGTNGIGGTSVSPTPFSPFGLKDQHDTSIPEQSTASEEALHQQ